MRITHKNLLTYLITDTVWKQFGDNFMSEAPAWASGEFMQDRMNCVKKWTEGKDNVNFMVTESAMKVIDRIKINVRDFDYTVLAGIARPMATIHIDNRKMFRYFTEKNKMSVIHFKSDIIEGGWYLNYVGFAIKMDYNEVIVAEDKYSLETFELFMQLMTFIELADTEITILEPHARHDKTKKDKMVNLTQDTFHIVDNVRKGGKQNAKS